MDQGGELPQKPSRTLANIVGVDKVTLERRQAEARLRGVVEMAVDGIITIDEYGTIETVNAAAQRSIQWTGGGLM